MLPARNILLSSGDQELLRYCKISFTKGTGPGGQKRNKTSSAVQIELPELNLSAQDCTECSQIRNRENALQKLRMEIAFLCRISPAVPPETMECSLNSPRYPLFAAQLLDVFADSKCDPRLTAEKCGVSPTALLKKLHRDPHLWQYIQKMRISADLHKLNPPS